MIDVPTPKSCKECPLTIGDHDFGEVCFFTGRPLMSEGRHEDCLIAKRETWFRIEGEPSE